MELTAGLVWLLVAAALVLFMTPGLAFFYGGMTRAKSALNMMMMSFVAIGTVGIMWVLWGASMATATKTFCQIFANPFSHFGLARLHRTGGPAQSRLRGHLRHHHRSPDLRRRRRPRQVLRLGGLRPVWATLVYAPLAFMVWGGGLFAADGGFGQTLRPVIDFAGGTVVHINAGVAGLILVLIIGNRKGFGKDPNHRPHNIPFVMLGAASCGSAGSASTPVPPPPWSRPA